MSERAQCLECREVHAFSILSILNYNKPDKHLKKLIIIAYGKMHNIDSLSH